MGFDRKRCLALAAALTLAGCSSDDATGPSSTDLGDFSGTLSGEFNATLTGNAGFGSAGIADFETSGITLAEDRSDPITISAVRREVGRIPLGTHTLGPFESGFYGEVVLPGSRFGVGGSETYISTSGTLVVTTSNAEEIRGTMSFTADSEFGSGTVTVEVTFRATCGPQVLFQCD